MPNKKNDMSFDESENHFSNSENEAPEISERVELPYVLKLEEAIKLKNKEFDHITFVTKPKTKALRHLPTDAQQQKIGHFLPIIGAMIAESSAIVDELSFVDLTRCLEIVNPFLTTSGTGKGNSA